MSRTERTVATGVATELRVLLVCIGDVTHRAYGSDRVATELRVLLVCIGDVTHSAYGSDRGRR
jgi:hypothetical protein